MNLKRRKLKKRKRSRMTSSMNLKRKRKTSASQRVKRRQSCRRPRVMVDATGLPSQKKCSSCRIRFARTRAPSSAICSAKLGGLTASCFSRMVYLTRSRLSLRRSDWRVITSIWSMSRLNACKRVKDRRHMRKLSSSWKSKKR